MKLYNMFGCSLLALVLLTGCGGGSSENTTPQTQTQSTSVGIVSDSQIIGLRYISTSKDKTQTKKGVTNSKGEFEYFEGGTTEFFVGNIKIGSTTPNKMVAITTVAKTEKESENIARFLQTIDEDGNPDNGIQISTSVDEHAKSNEVSNLKFDDSFDTSFESVKTELFKNVANIPETVTVEEALNHANKSVRLSSLKEFDLYKAVANEKNYRSGDYYNADVLEKSQRKRVYLWIWEKLLSKEMAIEDELQFTKPEFDINNVEETRNQIKKYLDYADVITGVASLGQGTYENIAKAGSRSFGYEVTKLTSLTVGGCSTVVKLYDANNQDAQELSDNDMCKNMMKVLNPVNDSASKLAIANPIISSFLPEVLPKLLHTKKMNWLHFNTKSLRTISKMKVSKPDVVSIALAIASISNDFYGASWASDINKELTTRMIAREWLDIWFRSGFNQAYMNKLINNNSKKLVGMTDQIDALTIKYGSTGVLCDTYKFFNPFYRCDGLEDMNVDRKKAKEIATAYISKSNALYRNITDLIGSVSDEKGEIGVVEFDWVKDTNLTDYNDTTIQTSNTSFHYRDEFNDINKSFWYIYRAQNKDSYNDNAISINNGILTLSQDKTDNGPIMISKAIPITNNSIITIKRKVYLHSQISYSYQGGDEFFVGGLSILSTTDNNFDSTYKDTLSQARYYDYEYLGDWDTFFLNENNSSNYIDSIWDNWFEEKLTYNTKTHESTLTINGTTVSNKIDKKVGKYIKIYIQTYGWWTGHFTKMDYIDISITKDANAEDEAMIGDPIENIQTLNDQPNL